MTTTTTSHLPHRLRLADLHEHPTSDVQTCQYRGSDGRGIGILIMWVPQFGIPEVVRSDNGSAFESAVFKALRGLLGRGDTVYCGLLIDQITIKIVSRGSRHQLVGPNRRPMDGIE